MFFDVSSSCNKKRFALLIYLLRKTLPSPKRIYLLSSFHLYRRYGFLASAQTTSIPVIHIHIVHLENVQINMSRNKNTCVKMHLLLCLGKFIPNWPIKIKYDSSITQDYLWPKRMVPTFIHVGQIYSIAKISKYLFGTHLLLSFSENSSHNWHPKKMHS